MQKKIILFILSILLNNLINKINNEKINFKICVCTCGKNENKYAREFVEHYKRYGIDKIFIYDNNENNDEKFEDVLSDYINNGYVKIYNYRNHSKIQMSSFNHCYQKNKNDFAWFIYYDMDEFIHLKSYNNIKEYISKTIFNKCNIIYLNHVIHTDNNEFHYFNKSLFERFPEIESFKKINMSYQPRTILLDLTKVIIRGNLTNITFKNPHFINNITSCDGFGNIITTKYNNIHLDKPDHKNFYFDHFYFKSLDEYLEKLNKASVFYGKKRGYNLYWFQLYFAINKITKEKLDYFENKTNTNLSFFRNIIEKIL